MAHISGGSVSFTKRVKTGDYEHAEGTATINFSVQDGEAATELLDQAGEMAYGKVYELLSLKAPRHTVSAPKPAIGPSSLETAAAPVEAKKRPGRPPGPRKVALTPAADPAAMEDPRAAENNPAVEADPAALDGEFLTPLPTTITDTDLTNAVTAKNGSLIKKHGPAGTTKIRELMAEFLKSGQSLVMIPKPVRQQFLDKLDLLA